MGEARDQILFNSYGRLADLHDDMNKLLQRSPTISSSSRPSTPATPPITANDLEYSPKTVCSSMMLDLDRKSDNLSPALPAKSSLRASRLLATLPQKRNKPENRPVLTPAAPHILYLSSEEDASSSADDFSDCEYEYPSDDEKFEATPQLPARMVSVIFSGKPSIIELPRRSISPSSSSSSTSNECSTPELVRTSTEPTLNRKSSASSDLSMAYYHPPRSSSMITGNFETQGHSFLQTDPFASKPDSSDEREVHQTRKASTMFKRTFSLVRKRSKPVLTSTENLSAQPLRMEQVGECKAEHHVSDAWAQVPRGAQTYQEIISSVRKNSTSSLSSPVSDIVSPISPGKKLRTGFMSRRKSIRI